MLTGENLFFLEDNVRSKSIWTPFGSEKIDEQLSRSNAQQLRCGLVICQFPNNLLSGFLSFTISYSRNSCVQGKSGWLGRRLGLGFGPMKDKASDNNYTLKKWITSFKRFKT
uniref:Uncharacterized protein n=1 Tax=Tetranychus urticae TaxID=32264 RepID=T1KWK8_TETUR